MNIAIIADPIDNQKGGVYVYTKEVVEGLIGVQSHHSFILLRERRDPSITHVKQIIIPNIRIGLGLAALRLFFIVPLVLWWHKVDAVFEPAHFGPFNLPRRIRRITMIHDLTPLLFPHYHRYHSQLLQKIFLKGILRRADIILANSKHTARDIFHFFPFAKKKVIPLPLGCDPVFGPHSKSNYLIEKGISNPYWLSVGTIEPRKNLLRLLEAFAQFREKTSGLTLLVIVGQTGWKSEPFFEALDRHPYKSSIILTGFIPDEDLASLYTHALALVYPSEYEGFGLPVLEAMTCGCPVICSSVSSLPEVGGDAAQYVDPFDVTTITQAMVNIYQLELQERKTLKEECIRQASGFSWEKHVKSFLRVLDNLESGLIQGWIDQPTQVASKARDFDKKIKNPR